MRSPSLGLQLLIAAPVIGLLVVLPMLVGSKRAHGSRGFEDEGRSFEVSRSGYRARAERDGRVEVTAVGATPVGFRTVRLGRGAASARAPEGSRVERGRVVFERGEVQEDFLPGTEGLEQSWHFPMLPAGEGPLHVRIQVSGASAVDRDALGLRVRPERGAPLRYGNATWIDALGRKTSLPAEWNGREIELTVPAALVVASAYPAVLDPLISPERPVDVTSAGAPLDQDSVAVARGSWESLVVWHDGRGPNAITASRLAPTGEVLDPAGIRVGTGSGPDVAFDGALTYLVVWSNANQILGARVRASDGVVLDATPITISNDTTVGPSQPTVAYAGSYFFVAWQQSLSASNTNRAIKGARVSSLGQLVDTTPRSITSDINFSYVGPRLATNGSAFLLAFRGKDNTTGNGADLWGARVDGTGAIVGSPFSISGMTAEIEGGVDLGFDGANYLIAWEASSTVRAVWVNPSTGAVSGLPTAVPSAATTGSPGVGCGASSCVVSWAVGTTDYAGVIASQAQTFGAEHPLAASAPNGPLAIVDDGTGFQLAWSDKRSGTADVYAQRVDGGLTALGADVRVTSGGASQQQPKAATAHGGTGDTLLVWSQNSGAGWDIYARRVAADGTFRDASPIPICAATGNQLEPQVVYDPTHAGWYVVWTDDGVTASLYGARVREADGAVLDPNGVALVSGSPASHVAVAAAPGGLLAVYEDGTYGLAAVRIDGGTGAKVSSPFLVGGGAADDSAYGAAIGTGSKGFFLVWVHDYFDSTQNAWNTELLGAPVDPPTGMIGATGQISGGAPRARVIYAMGHFHVLLGTGAITDQPVDENTFALETAVVLEPSAAQSFEASSDGTTLVAIWTTSTGEVRGRRFLPDGTLLDPATSLVPPASAQHGTAVAGPLTGTQYLAAYDRSEPANANGGVGAYFRLVDFTQDADATPPLAGQVNDGPGPDLATQPSVDTFEANWSGFDDPESGIFQYEWAIGSTAGGTEVQPFTAVGTQTRASASGLALEVGKTYVVTVRATNGSGLTTTARSDGVTIDPSVPATPTGSLAPWNLAVGCGCQAEPGASGGAWALLAGLAWLRRRTRRAD